MYDVPEDREGIMCENAKFFPAGVDDPTAVVKRFIDLWDKRDQSV